jgi:hypothetical protein
MTWTVAASGTQTPTVGTEATLTTQTTNSTFVYYVDTTNLANGDTVELRVYTIVLSGGASDLVWKGTYSNVQLIPVAQSPFVASDQSIKVTLKQTAGTARAFPWKLLSQ